MDVIKYNSSSKMGLSNLGKAFNIEYGNIEKKGNIESMLSKFENWKRTRNGPETDPPWGGVGGGDC